MTVPTIEQVIPNSAAEGEKVKIKGKYLRQTKTVKFRDITCEFNIDSDSEITVTVPKIETDIDNINIKVLNSENKGSGKVKFKAISKSTSPNQTSARKSTPSVSPKPIPPTTPSSAVTLTKTTTVLSTTKPRDLDRARAQFAWEKIQIIKSQEYQAKYGSLARKMPTLIQVNGLAQTLAFLKAKGKKDDPQKEHFIQAFDHLSDWVCNNRLNSGTGNLLDRVLRMDSQNYRLVTNESLAFLQWLKRFAEGELGSEEDK